MGVRSASNHRKYFEFCIPFAHLARDNRGGTRRAELPPYAAKIVDHLRRRGRAQQESGAFPQEALGFRADRVAADDQNELQRRPQPLGNVLACCFQGAAPP